jgi:hypothetical protein
VPWHSPRPLLRYRSSHDSVNILASDDTETVVTRKIHKEWISPWSTISKMVI